MKLAEMVNSANYASMSYQELVTINFALRLAVLDIKSLIGIKKAEEMATHTQEYLAKMKSYCATKDEILACIEREMIEMPPHAPITPQGADDQTSDVVPDIVMNEHQENHEVPLLLPEHKDVDASRGALAEVTPKEDETVQDDTAVSSPEEESQTAIPEHQDEEKDLEESDSAEVLDAHDTKEPENIGTIVTKTKEQTLIDEALEISRTMRLPNDIDVNAPYYAEQKIKIKKNGAIDSWKTRTGKNLSTKDLEAFRAAVEKHESLFRKNKVLASTEDYLVTYDGEQSVFVYCYHFPDETDIQKDLSGQSSIVTGEEIKSMKKSNALMERAIKKAKELSTLGEPEAHLSFYDKYIFYHHGCNWLDLYGNRERCYEDAATLKEIMPAYETFARLCEDFRVLAKDNCIAAMGHEAIYVILCNFPNQEKKRKASKKPAPMVKDITTPEGSASVSSVSTDQGVSNVIIKATEVSRALPVSKGTNINTPYYVQQDYVISNDGGLFPDGKTFSTNISIDTLDKNKASHRKLARAMKASALVSGNDYTAFIWNDGKNVRVYSYHV